MLWAVVIAVPLAWVLMQRWLSGYAYHVMPGPWRLSGRGGAGGRDWAGDGDHPRHPDGARRAGDGAAI